MAETTETTTFVAPEATPETKALNAEIDSQESENRDPVDEALAKTEEEPKKELSPEEREKRWQRKVERLIQQRGELREKLRGFSENRLTDKPVATTNEPSDTDSDTLTLPKSQLEKLVLQEAERLAPSIAQKRELEGQMRSAAASVRKELGADVFDELTSEAAEIFDAQKQLAILRTDKPAAVLRYLTDPDNYAEAKSIAAMPDFDAGRAFARIENKLRQADEKPKASKVPEPIEPVKGHGNTPKHLFDLDGDAFDKRRREQIANRR
jgi:hypothetical protein